MYHPSSLLLVSLLCLHVALPTLAYTKIPEEADLYLQHLFHPRPLQRSEDSWSKTYQYESAAVASDNANCSQVGASILEEKGGNAIDASIATALCLGVLQPFASGIGGGGIAVIYFNDGTASSYDFREFAPGAANSTMFVNDTSASLLGGRAIAIPGEVAGMWNMWSEYGQASWEDIVQPAIDYANSSIVSPLLAIRLEQSKALILSSPSLSSVFAPDGTLLQEGDILRQPALAATLTGIQQDPLQFYEGSIADMIVEDIQAAGGIATNEDFKKYIESGVVHREPITYFFEGLQVIGAAPPISGGLCSALSLNLLERFNFAQMGNQSALAQHYMIESWKWAFSDRMALGDPEFVDLSQVSPYMLSKKHAAQLRQKFSSTTTYPPPHYVDLTNSAPLYDYGTTHISVVDQYGNAVAMTSTINTSFGSGVLSRQTGIVLNNEMDDFSTPNTTNYFGVPASEENYIQPYKKPLSSMTPTIVLSDDQLYMVVGASGGTKIITATLQVLLDVIAWNQTIGDAISKPRCHNQNTGETIIEPNYPQDFQTFLTSTNHILVPADGPLACVQGIVVQSNGTLAAASDWRKLGLPAGF